MKLDTLKNSNINQNGYHKNVLTKERIGTLFIYPIDFTPDDCLSCEGYSLQINDYEDLYKVIGTQFNQADDEEGTFRIPDYNITGLFLQPGLSNFGTKKSAGLPKIDLALRIDAKGKVDTYYGSKYLSAYGLDDYGGAMNALSDGSDEPMRLMSNATSIKYRAGDLILDTNIYGKSTTVQPPSQIVHICIKYK